MIITTVKRKLTWGEESVSDGLVGEGIFEEGTLSRNMKEKK